jgi:hypothetical protein
VLASPLDQQRLVAAVTRGIRGNDAGGLKLAIVEAEAELTAVRV